MSEGDVWFSYADWGDYDIFNGHKHNITHDKHWSKLGAEGVCRRLRGHGFGGNGQVFPVRAWVSQEKPEDILAGIEKPRATENQNQ